MLSFKEFLAEAFDKPYKWSAFRNGAGGVYIAKATTDNNKKLEIGLEDDASYSSGLGGSVEIDFTVDGSQDITNEGDQFRIFATVMDFIKYVLDREPNVNSIYFTANKSRSSSRSNLYKRMLKKYLPNWKINVVSRGSYDEITAFKPEK